MRFESDSEVEAFIERFEAGGFSAIEWTHAAHVAMAGAYVLQYGDAAFHRIRAGIHHLNWHHGTITTPDRGYHETLTVFWTRILEGFCHEHAGLCRFELMNLAMEQLPSALFKEYYGFDVVRSREARQVWMAPDLRSLNGSAALGFNQVFVLWHTREFENGRDDEKLIGVYRTETDARAALERVRQQPGFVDHPQGFEIVPATLNKDAWTEGFVTV